VTVTFLEVGQGDCTIVIDHESSLAMLIDCPRGAERIAVDEIQRHGAELDTALVTHSHLDHFGGVLDAVEALGCRRLLYNHDTFLAQPRLVMDDGTERRDPAVVASLRRVVELSNDQLWPATLGTNGTLGRTTYSVISPRHRDLTQAIISSKPNIASGIVVVATDGVRVLIGGDADASIWRELLQESILPTVAAVRWPHHGADLDTNVPGLATALMNELAPEIVVVSVGANNSYDHPADSFFDTVRPSPAQLMCTNATSKCAAADAQPCARTVSLHISAGSFTSTPAPASHDARVRLFPSPRCLS
jgi:competence protein ComEC